MKNLKELWRELFTVEEIPTNEDLRYIIQYIESLRTEARSLLKHSKDEIMADIKSL